MRRGASGEKPEVCTPDSEPDPRCSSVPLGAGLGPFTPGNTAGFTLVEMILVLCLVGILMTLVLPRTGIANPLPSATRALVATIRSLQTAAATAQKPFRLYLDLDQRRYWAVALEGAEERTPVDPVLARRETLPEPIRFLAVTTPSRGRIESGRVSIQVLPTGKTDPAAIVLADEDQDMLTVKIHAVTGALQIVDRAAEDSLKEPIPNRLRVLVQPLVGSAASLVPVVGGNP